MTPKLDKATAREFLLGLFGAAGVPGYWLALRGLAEKGTQGHFSEGYAIPFDRSDWIEIAMDHFARWNQHGRGALFIPALVMPEFDGQGRPHFGASSVRAMTALCIDIDSGDPVGALRHAVDYIGPPTYTVESGGRTPQGKAKLHAYWLLRFPIAAKEGARMRGLLAAKLGGDPAFERQAQLIRMPGSLNHKNGGAVPVKLVGRSGVVIEDLADFVAKLEAMPVAPGVRPPMAAVRPVQEPRALVPVSSTPKAAGALQAERGAPGVRLNYGAIKADLLADAYSICRQLWPRGKKVGPEYKAERQAEGGPGDSLSVNLETGKWLYGRKHAAGTDILGLLAYLRHGTGDRTARVATAHALFEERGRPLAWREGAAKPTKPERWQRIERPAFELTPRPLNEVRSLIAERMGAFMRRYQFQNGGDGGPKLRSSDWYDKLREAWNVPPGVGKTRAFFLAVLMPEAAGWQIAVYIPSMELGVELETQWNAEARRLEAATGVAHPRVILIRGRGQSLPDGTPMCARYDLVQPLEKLGEPIFENLCARVVGRRKDPKTKETIKTVSRCPHYQTCPYIKQMADKEPAIRVMAHQMAFLGTTGLPEPQIVFIDEKFHAAGWRGADAKSRVWVSVERVVKARPTKVDPENDPDNARFRSAVAGCELLARALESATELSVEALRKVGLSAKHCVVVATAWRKEAEYFKGEPGDNDANLAAKIDTHAASANMEARKMYRLWLLLAREMWVVETHKIGGKPQRDRVCSVTLARDADFGDGKQDVLFMAWRERLSGEVRAASLIMADATMSAKIISPYFGGEEPRVEAFDVEWPESVEVLQIPDAPVSKNKLLKSEGASLARLREFRAFIEQRAALLEGKIDIEGNPARLLVVSNKPVIKALKKLDGMPLPTGVDWAWYNNVAGKNQYRLAREVIVIGAASQSVAQAEAGARVHWWDSPEPLEEIPREASPPGKPAMDPFLPQVARGIQMRDGTVRAILVPCHPDPRTQELIEQSREAEILQAVGRLRLLDRTPENPATVWIFASVALPLPVDELLNWKDVEPTMIEFAWERERLGRGVMPLSATWLVEHHPDLFGSESKANREGAAFRRRNCQNPIRLSNRVLTISAEYRLEGQSRWSRALIRKGHPAPEAALAAAVGGPVKFRWVDDAPSPTGGAQASPAPDLAPAEGGQTDLAPSPPAASQADPSPRPPEAPAPGIDPNAMLCGRALPPSMILIHPTAKEAAAIAPAETRARVGAIRFEAWHGQDGDAELVTIRRPGVKTAPEKGKILPERNAPMDKPQTELRPLARLVFDDASAPGWLRTAVAKGELGHRTRYLFEPDEVLQIAENEAEPAPLRIEAAAEMMRAWRKVASVEEQDAFWRQHRPAIDEAKLFIMREGMAACDRRDARARGEVVAGDALDDAETLRLCARIMNEPRGKAGGARA